MTDETKSQRPVTDAIGVILDEGQRVRERIQQIVADTAKDDEFSVGSLARAARTVMQGAYQAVGAKVEKSVPRDQDGALRDVVYGIGDAFNAAALAAGEALSDAAKRGREFAADDVKKVAGELRNLGTGLVEAVTDSGQSAVGQWAEHTKTVAQHATKAAEDIKPAVESALTAAAQHPVKLTREAASAGVGVTREVAGSLFAVVGKLMNRTSDALRGSGPSTASSAVPEEGHEKT